MWKSAIIYYLKTSYPNNNSRIFSTFYANINRLLKYAQENSHLNNNFLTAFSAAGVLFLYCFYQVLYGGFQGGIGFYPVLYFLAGMHHRCMIPAAVIKPHLRC
jgi:hypothetical protein